MIKASADEFLEFLKSRRSVRKYIPGKVNKKDIERMLLAASYAPSGNNLQNWKFIIISSGKIKNAMLEEVVANIKEKAQLIKSPRARNEYIAYSGYYTFFADAPVVIAAVRKPYDTLTTRIMKKNNIPFHTDAGIQSVSAAVQNFILMAHFLGYGACWMTGPLIARENIERILRMDKQDELAALIALGKYDNSGKFTGRKGISEISSFIV